MLMNSGEYLDLVQIIKQEIQSAQYRAALNVNRELICLHYDIGSAINEHKTWGNKFVEKLAADIKLAFPEAKGYSVRNLKYMAKFAATYPNREFVQTVSAQNRLFFEKSNPDLLNQDLTDLCKRHLHKAFEFLLFIDLWHYLGYIIS